MQQITRGLLEESDSSRFCRHSIVRLIRIWNSRSSLWAWQLTRLATESITDWRLSRDVVRSGKVPSAGLPQIYCAI